MKQENISWDEFKLRVADHIKKGAGPRLCRGQANADWKLKTSFHRNPNGVDFQSYFAMLTTLADMIGTIEGRRININDPDERGAFVAYLQHHGYATPLLDWTLSPYIAAYFAYSDLKCLEFENVAVYVFDYLKWMAHWETILDFFSDKYHVSVFSPLSNGNIRQLVQQGTYYMFTNIDDVESHISAYEEKSKDSYLDKFLIPSSERNYVLTDLDAMGINEYSLFRTTDALCRSFRDAIFIRSMDGKGAIERMREIMLENLQTPIKNEVEAIKSK